MYVQINLSSIGDTDGIKAGTYNCFGLWRSVQSISCKKSLVARRVRENNVYCEIYSYKTPLEEIKKKNPKGIILTGGPDSYYLPDSATYSKELFELGVPVLGLCYGAQLMQHLLGGKKVSCG